jgi:hypothetical protein
MNSVAEVVKWQTRTFEGRVAQAVRVQVPPSAPNIFPRPCSLLSKPANSVLDIREAYLVQGFLVSCFEFRVSGSTSKFQQSETSNLKPETRNQKLSKRFNPQ